MAAVFLFRTGAPTADIVAKQAELTADIRVADFAPGQVEVVGLASVPVIVWRRSADQMDLARAQNDPDAWLVKTSHVFGQADPVPADDASLSLEGEWFFVLATPPGKFTYLLPEAGEYDGFFEGGYASHFDLSGRVRRFGGQSASNLTVVLGHYSSDRTRIEFQFSAASVDAHKRDLAARWQ